MALITKLTDKQNIFANEYLINLNATRAYKKAYYNVKKDSVASAAVMKYLTKVMRNELTEEVVVVEGEGCSSARIVKKGISAKDRNKAAELLGKRYRLFTEKIEVDGVQQIQMVYDIDD